MKDRPAIGAMVLIAIAALLFFISAFGAVWSISEDVCMVNSKDKDTGDTECFMRADVNGKMLTSSGLSLIAACAVFMIILGFEYALDL